MIYASENTKLNCITFANLDEELDSGFIKEFDLVSVNSDKIETILQCKFVDHVSSADLFEIQKYFYVDVNNKAMLFVGPKGKKVSVRYSDPLEITIEHGFCPVHFRWKILYKILYVCLVEAGGTILHSSCALFPETNDICAIVACGGVGKTDTLLKMLKRGWKYVSDDKTIIDKNGYIVDIKIPLNLFQYNIDYNPWLNKKLPYKKSFVRLLSLGMFQRILSLFDFKDNTFWSKLYEYIHKQYRLSSNYVLQPNDIGFLKADITEERINKIFLLEKSSQGDLKVEKVEDRKKVIEKLYMLNIHEYNLFLPETILAAGIAWGNSFLNLFNPSYEAFSHLIENVEIYSIQFSCEEQREMIVDKIEKTLERKSLENGISN